MSQVQGHPAAGLPSAGGGRLSPPTPTGPPLPVWSCAFEQGKTEGSADLKQLTVGAKFLLSCHGDIPVEWKEDAGVSVSFPKKEDAYSLHVLGIESLGPKGAQFVVTAYKPGKHEPEYIRIVQGSQGFEVTKPVWEVQSVLPKDQPPQPPPPFGPWNLQIPMWFFAAIFLAFCLVGFVIVRKLRKTSQRNRMLGELALHKTALSPVNQFYRDSRVIRRRLNGAGSVEELKQISGELNRDFRLYVLRQFQIPTLEWSDRAIVDDLKKRHRKVYLQAAEPLRKTLRELGRLQSQPSPLLPDVEQLHRMSLDAVERIETAKEQAARKGAPR